MSSMDDATLKTRRAFLSLLGKAGVKVTLAAALWESLGSKGLAGTTAPATSQAASESATRASHVEHIKVRADNWGFVGKESGQPFVPFGCNYYDPDTDWPPKIWRDFDADRVRRHFELMQGLGVNVCRVFLSVKTFMPRKGELSADGLKKLDTMIAIGKEHGIRFDLSALNNWEGRPQWWRGDFWSDPDVLAGEAAYLEALFSHYRGEGAIFCVDLANEPQVTWNSPQMRSQWNQWLRRELANRPDEDQAPLRAYMQAHGEDVPPPPDKPAENDPVLYAYQCFREWIGTRWAQQNAQAVKRGDPDRLVSTGLVQWSFPLANSPSGYAAVNPQQIAEAMDFTSVHFYPILANERRLSEQFPLMQQYCKAWVRYAWCGKPIVVEEFGWAGGGPKEDSGYYTQQEQAAWNTGLIELTRDSACGWLVWPFADCIDSKDVSKWAGLLTQDGKMKAWGTAFQGLARQFKGNPPVRSRPEKTIRVNMRRALTTLGEKIPMYETRYSRELLSQFTLDGSWNVVQER